MPITTVPPRSAIAREHTWDAESVFASAEAWEAELKSVLADLPKLTAYQGRLSQGAAVLLAALDTLEGLAHRIGHVFVYAALAHSVDTTDQVAAARNGQAQAAMGQVSASLAFIRPELLAIGRETLASWLAVEPRLMVYAHFVEDLFRKQAHVRSAEVEELLGLAGDAFSGPQSAYNMLTNADFKFAPAVGAGGESLPLTQGTLGKILAGLDREARRGAWENYADQHLAHKHTLASTLASSIKQNVFQMRVRRHATSLGASLFEYNIPEQVFHNLIAVFQKNLPTWHRYWAVRRQILGVDTLQPYDIWAPLSANKPQVPFTQAVEWICQGLAPMGAEYVEQVRRGCLQERWVDIYPNAGKSAGAFSWGMPGTRPFIVMNYTDEVLSLSTLAHELGHSLHSYLTWKNQPYVYADYSLFAAEVASNFHQALVRAHLFQTQSDPAFQLSLLEEAFSNFHRYFFIMPTLARFELEAHRRVERGEGLTADSLIDLMADLFSEGYGGQVNVDRARVGITWATFSHLYADYYVYQYATGIAGAHAFARRILDGAPGAVSAYQGFLQAGSSQYPLDALRTAGVDLASPEPVEAAFQVLANMVDRLEKLAAQPA